MEVITRNEKETGKAAFDILKDDLNKHKRDNALVVALSGELGGGKTAFVKGLAESLGVKERVLSPTFVIERCYRTENENFSSLIHIDAYRLSSGEDLRVLDWESKVKNKRNIICLEWPENVVSAVPKEAVPVSFEFISENERVLRY